MKIQLMEGGICPAKSWSQASGYDLFYPRIPPLRMKPGDSYQIGLCIRIALPKGTMGMIVPRFNSGADGLILTNSVGILDSDYQGEIRLAMKNTHDKLIHILEFGDRLAQMIVIPIFSPEIRIVDSLTPTKRGEGGFGSTGR